MWVTNWLTGLFFLRLAAYCLLLAGSFFVLLAVTILLFRRLRNTRVISWISNKLWLDWKVISVTSELPGVGRFVGRVVPVLAAFALGYMTDEIQRYDHRHSERLEIVHKYDSRHDLVQVLDPKTGAIVGSPFRFAICPDETAPDFDEGMVVDVIYEESTGGMGHCNTFEGKHLGYVAVREDDEAWQPTKKQSAQ